MIEDGSLVHLLRLATVLVLVLSGCEARVALGASCARNGDCAQPLACLLGRCRTECVTSRDCPITARCLIDPPSGLGVCSLPDADRCRSGECPAGFVCLSGADECVNACGAIVACPDGVCEDGACVPRRDDVDGGVESDAAPPDAATDSGVCAGPACDHVRRIVAGWDTMFAITDSNALWAWGESGSGEIGDRLVAHGTCADCSPVPVQALDQTGNPFGDVVEVDAGESHVCVLREDTSVWCWGTAGALGDGTMTASLVPVPVQWLDGGSLAFLDDVVHIAAGREHTCAIKTAGDVWCWGHGRMGALGTGSETDALRAVRATELPGASEIDAAYSTTLVVSGGAVMGVGENDWRQIGGISPSGFALTLVTSSVVDAVQLAVSGAATCALRSNGDLACWGRERWGSLGTTVDCGTDECTEMPQRMLPAAGAAPWEGVVGDRTEYCYFAWTTDGAVYGFGAAADGVFAPGIENALDPRLRDGLPPVRDIAMANGAVCAVARDGDVWCWGAGDDGQLGRGVHGTGQFSATPERVLWPE